MKKVKLIMMVSLILVLFSSCAKVDDMREPSLKEPNEIVFNSRPVVTTTGNRAPLKAPVHQKTDMTENFGVYGYVHTASAVSGGYLMKNAEYVVATGKPAGIEKYYWPKADNLSDIKVNFVALYPYSNNTNDYSLGADDTLTYNLSATALDSAHVIDVLWATRYQYSPVNTILPQANDTNTNVALNFKHALSLVEFVAKKADNQNIAKVTVTSIEFLVDGNNAAEIVTDGTLKIHLKDAISGSDANYKPIFTPGTTKANNFNFAVNAVKDSLLGGTSWTNNDVLSSAIIIPQAVPAKVRITFDITIANATGESITYSGRTVTRDILSTTGTPEKTGQTYVDNWESGKRYIYRFYISADDVVFDITVDDWTDTNPFDVWDHNNIAYVEHFFDKASTMQA